MVDQSGGPESSAQRSPQEKQISAEEVMPACLNGHAPAMLLFTDIVRRGALTLADINCFPDREGTADIHAYWMVHIIRLLESAYSRQQLESALEAFSQQHYSNQQDLAEILTHLKASQGAKPQDTGRWQMSDGPDAEAEQSAHSRAVPREPAAAGAAGPSAEQHEEHVAVDDRAAAIEAELAALAAADPRFAAAYQALQQSGQGADAAHHQGSSRVNHDDDAEILRQSGSRSKQQDIEEGLVQRLLSELEQRYGPAAAAAGAATNSFFSSSNDKKLDVGKCQTNLRQHVQNRVPLFMAGMSVDTFSSAVRKALADPEAQEWASRLSSGTVAGIVAKQLDKTVVSEAGNNPKILSPDTVDELLQQLKYSYDTRRVEFQAELVELRQTGTATQLATAIKQLYKKHRMPAPSAADELEVVLSRFAVWDRLLLENCLKQGPQGHKLEQGSYVFSWPAFEQAAATVDRHKQQHGVPGAPVLAAGQPGPYQQQAFDQQYQHGQYYQQQQHYEPYQYAPRGRGGGGHRGGRGGGPGRNGQGRGPPPAAPEFDIDAPPAAQQPAAGGPPPPVRINAMPVRVRMAGSLILAGSRAAVPGPQPMRLADAMRYKASKGRSAAAVAAILGSSSSVIHSRRVAAAGLHSVARQVSAASSSSSTAVMDSLSDQAAYPALPGSGSSDTASSSCGSVPSLATVTVAAGTVSSGAAGSSSSAAAAGDAPVYDANSSSDSTSAVAGVAAAISAAADVLLGGEKVRSRRPPKANPAVPGFEAEGTPALPPAAKATYNMLRQFASTLGNVLCPMRLEQLLAMISSPDFDGIRDALAGLMGPLQDAKQAEPQQRASMAAALLGAVMGVQLLTDSMAGLVRQTVEELQQEQPAAASAVTAAVEGSAAMGAAVGGSATATAGLAAVAERLAAAGARVQTGGTILAAAAAGSSSSEPTYQELQPYKLALESDIITQRIADPCEVMGDVNGVSVPVVLDIGAGLSVISLDYYLAQPHLFHYPGSPVRLMLLDDPMAVGLMDLDIQRPAGLMLRDVPLGIGGGVYNTHFLLLPRSPFDIMLGLEWLQAYGGNISGRSLTDTRANLVLPLTAKLAKPGVKVPAPPAHLDPERRATWVPTQRISARVIVRQERLRATQLDHRQLPAIKAALGY